MRNNDFTSMHTMWSPDSESRTLKVGLSRCCRQSIQTKQDRYNIFIPSSSQKPLLKF